MHLQIPGYTMGETMGVATNSKGHLFVYSRSNPQGIARGGAAAMLWEFDQNGKYVKEWGPHSYAASFAHAVRVDKNDNVWPVDEGSGMIIKYNPKGEQDFWLGRTPEAIDYLEANLEILKYRPPDRGVQPAPGGPQGRVRPRNRHRLGFARQHASSPTAMEIRGWSRFRPMAIG